MSDASDTDRIDDLDQLETEGNEVDLIEQRTPPERDPDAVEPAPTRRVAEVRAVDPEVPDADAWEQSLVADVEDDDYR